MTAILEPSTTTGGAPVVEADTRSGLVTPVAGDAPGRVVGPAVPAVPVGPVALAGPGGPAGSVVPAGSAGEGSRGKRVLTATGIRLVGVAMLAVIVGSELLQPAADGAEPVRPVWLETLYTIQTVALLAAAAGFLLGRRWALGSAVVVAGIGAFNVAMCPAVGHHVVAGWWFGQVALAAVLLALPALALWRTRAG